MKSVARLGATATAIVAVAVALALLIGGNAPERAYPGLPDPGLGTGWAYPVVHGLNDLLAVLTVGLLLAAAFLLPHTKGSLGVIAIKCVVTASVTAGLWAVVALTQGILALSFSFGAPIARVLDPTVVSSFFSQTNEGKALLIQFFGALILALSCWTITRAQAATTALIGALLVVIPPALTGHSGASDRHEIAISSLMLHIAGISLWVGGLCALVLIAAWDKRALRHAISRYSTLALWAYVVVIGSGLANAWIRLSALSDIWTTGYGRLLLIKTGCAIALGWLGWYHRKRTVRSSVLHGKTADFIRFATIEVVIMVATIGVGVGLSQTAPPVNDAIDLTKASAARLVLGFELPPPPTAFSVLVQQVRPDALWIFVALLLGALYAVGIRKLAAQGDTWPIGRTISWVAGWLIILWSTSGGIATYSHVLFSAHMVQHMLLSTVAPIFLVLGAPASLALRALPTGSNGAGVRELLVSVLNSRFIHFVSNPIVAAIIFVSGFFGLYFTPLFPALMASHWGHTIMQVHFVLAGYLFFWTLIGIDPGPKRAPYPIRILVLLVPMSIHAFFNIAILQSNEILAQSYFASIQRTYLTDLLADQRVGAGIGWALGELPLLIVMITLTLQWARSDARDAKRSDRQADRAERGDGGPDELGDYNAYLAKLADRDAKN